MVDEGAQSVVTNEAADNVTRAFCGVRGPNRGNVLMLHHPRALNIEYEVLMKCLWVLRIPEWKLSPHVDFVWFFWQVYPRPSLQAYRNWKGHDILNWHLFIWGIVNVHALSELS